MIAPGSTMPRPPRAFTRAWLIGGTIATLLFAWTLTEGASAFLTRQNQSSFYEAQARSLLDLRWDMPKELLNLEAFIVNDKAYMYFGPVPAVLRLPLVAVTRRFDGRVTQLSMLAAFVVSLAVLRRLTWRARWLTLGDRAVGRRESWATGMLCVLLGGGSVLLFLASRAWVYHEAILWGIAFSLAAYDRIIAFILTPRGRHLALASLFATCAVLSRGSVGAGPVAALALLLVGAVWSRTNVRRLLTLAAAVLLPIALYGYVNVAKFGTLYSVPVDKQLETAVTAERRAVLRANDGALFGPQFVPTTVLQYARPDALGFESLLPWIAFPGHRATVIGDVTFDNLDRASSIPASMPALTFLTAVGLAAVFRPSRARRPCDGGHDRGHEAGPGAGPLGVPRPDSRCRDRNDPAVHDRLHRAAVPGRRVPTPRARCHRRPSRARAHERTVVATDAPRCDRDRARTRRVLRERERRARALVPACVQRKRRSHRPVRALPTRGRRPVVRRRCRWHHAASLAASWESRPTRGRSACWGTVTARTGRTPNAGGRSSARTAPATSVSECGS